MEIDASFNEVIDIVKDNISSNINCHNIGRIIAYDNTTNTVQVELMQLKQWQNRTITPVIIGDVPLVTFGSKQARITVNPIGCNCVLLFMDRNIDNFMETGEQHLPDTNRMHNISDCVALLTIDSNVDTMPMYDENAMTISNNEAYIKLYNDTIEIANTKQKLSGLIQEFLVACENIAVTPNTGIITETSKANFTNLKTKFSELLASIEDNNNV